MVNATCLSGQDPMPLTYSNSCNLGFLCLNNTAENPPVFCPPTQTCQTIRFRSFDNVCPEPQGPYEPIVCSPGYYCPAGGQEQIQCPGGYYCPLGTYNPIRCTTVSVCPAGSMREIPLVGILSLGVIYVLWVLLAAVPLRKWKSIGIWQWLRARLSGTKVRETDAEVIIGDVSNEKNLSGSGEEVSEDECHRPQAGNLFQPLMKERKMYQLGLEFSFTDLQYRLGEVSHPILTGISGSIRRGRAFGIMGPSGAGKSTLISILAGRTRPTSGSTAINGVQEDLAKFSHLIGFVPQDDIVLPELTVRENILHTAYIRLGGIWRTEKIRSHVDAMIAYLGLTHVKDQLVGSVEQRGISGGERKRVCIALEIVAMPMAVILDEPTSGLDATSALSIMTLLKGLSTLGITVVCAVHQPRTDIFRLLDDILLLVSGKPIYIGETAQVVEHFGTLGYSFPDGCNPADVLMDTVTNRQFGVEPLKIHPSGLIPMGGDSERPESTSTLEKVWIRQKAPWYRQVLLYMLCGARQQSRQVFSIVLEMVTGAAAGLLIGLSVYEHRGHLFQGNFRESFGPLSSAVNYTLVPTVGLLSSLGISLAAAPAGIKTIAEEKLIFYQEIHSGHSSCAYFSGKDLATWPRMLVSSLHFTTFYMILATSRTPFHTLFLLNAVYFFCIYGLASLVASLVRRQDALLMAMLASLIAGILDGFGPRLLRVKSWHMAWLWYICPGTWYSEAFFSEHTMPFSYLYDVDAAASFTGYVTGRTSLDLGLIVVIGVVYRILAYVALVLPTVNFKFSFLKKLFK